MANSPTVKERWQHVRGGMSSRRVSYLVEDCRNEDEAIAATAAVAPSYWTSTLMLIDIEIQEVDMKERVTDVNEDGKNTFYTTAVYEFDDHPIDSQEAQFNFQSDQLRIDRSISTREAVADGAAAGADFGRYIGLDPKTGKAQGAVVQRPFGWLSVKWYHYQTTAQSNNYWNKIFRELMNHVNNQTFYGFSPGEVLMIGAQSTPVRRTRYLNPDNNFATSKWEFQFTYGIKANESAKQVGAGSDITISPQGWDEWWAWWDQRDVTDGNSVPYKAPKVLQANVEQTYDIADLTQAFIPS